MWYGNSKLILEEDLPAKNKNSLGYAGGETNIDNNLPLIFDLIQ